MQDKTSILLVYTGGTIGMKQDPVSFDLRPFDFCSDTASTLIHLTRSSTPPTLT